MGLLDRCVPARPPLSRCPAAAQRALSRACRKGGAPCPEVRLRARHGRAQAAAAGELRAGPRSCRPPASRSTRRKRPFVIVDPRAGHGPGIGGFKAAERDRRCLQGRPSLLLHRLPARAGARADDRGHRARRGRVPRARDRAASGSRGQARRHRQLPGRMGGDAACGHAAGALRADHRRRLAALLLGGRARRKTPCATRAGCWAAAGSPR